MTGASTPRRVKGWWRGCNRFAKRTGEACRMRVDQDIPTFDFRVQDGRDRAAVCLFSAMYDTAVNTNSPRNAALLRPRSPCSGGSGWCPSETRTIWWGRRTSRKTASEGLRSPSPCWWTCLVGLIGPTLCPATPHCADSFSTTRPADYWSLRKSFKSTQTRPPENVNPKAHWIKVTTARIYRGRGEGGGASWESVRGGALVFVSKNRHQVSVCVSSPSFRYQRHYPWLTTIVVF